MDPQGTNNNRKSEKCAPLKRTETCFSDDFIMLFLDSKIKILQCFQFEC